jgi:preprotein translocase subunit SecE
VAELIAGMFNNSRYKRSQGKVARNITLYALAAVFAVAAWKLNTTGETEIQRYVIPLIVLFAGWWASFRIVNIPKFADFLISVEAEMNKVSWPDRAEAWRASLVVMIVIFLLAALLFTYDIVLKWIMDKILGI